jgi:hypothetical protein
MDMRPAECLVLMKVSQQAGAMAGHWASVRAALLAQRLVAHWEYTTAVCWAANWAAYWDVKMVPMKVVEKAFCSGDSTADNLAAPKVVCSVCYWAAQKGDSMDVRMVVHWVALWDGCSAARKAGP